MRAFCIEYGKKLLLVTYWTVAILVPWMCLSYLVEAVFL